MKIYFAGSIRGGRDDKDLYFAIIKLLQNYGQVLTEHVGDMKLSVMGENKAEVDIFKRDLNWVKEADVIVAEVTTPSLGVGYELGKAEEFGKKVLCLYRPQDDRSLSAMISGNKNFIIKEYTDLMQAEKILKGFLG
ncbi:MAG: nucleoside 2-deoxyribosyltransferase [Patescibacteria group bacterium]|jgi:nucleoside 2-deoxyribosyltransferase